MRATGAIVLVVLLALAAGASTAQADTASLLMEFTEGRANVGVQLSVANDEDALFKAPDTALFEAEIDPESGEITDGHLAVPAFSTHITDPIDADVTVEFEIGTISGSFDQETGVLTGSGTAGGTLTSGENQCTVAAITDSPNPEILTLSTTGSTGGLSSLSGSPFTMGLTGAGAVAGA